MVTKYLTAIFIICLGSLTTAIIIFFWSYQIKKIDAHGKGLPEKINTVTLPQPPFFLLIIFHAFDKEINKNKGSILKGKNNN
jgi:hypothetical protein